MEDDRCYRHGFEMGEARCRNCGLAYCSECLVYSFGANKPPYCIPCALAAAGVRSSAAVNTTASKRELRKMERERKKAQKAKKAEKAEKPKVEVSPMAEVDDAPTTGDENPFAWADDPDSGQRVPF
jgi:hypothetical protein